MLLITISIIGIIAIILLIIGFMLKPPNPYLLIPSAMLLSIIALSILNSGIEAYTGEILINSTPEGNNTASVINQETVTYSGKVINSFSIGVLLVSLYIAFFSIGEIIEIRKQRRRDDLYEEKL